MVRRHNTNWHGAFARLARRGEAATWIFPRRGDCVVLDFVGDGFPFPLAITYDWLQAALDDQDPVVVAWRFRDAFECLIKLASSLAIADFLRDSTQSKAAEGVVRTLFRPMAPGDWFTLLGKALKPLDPLAHAGRLAESPRRLPGLHGVFFKAKGGGPTAISDHIAGKPSSFIAWRNRVFGHGVFREDRRWYAEETTRLLGPLHECLEALRPIFEGWDLVGDDPEGHPIVWRGTLDLPPTPPHRHSPWGPPRSMILRPRAGGPILPLGPLLSVQECAFAACRQPAAFFFDGHEHKKDRHRTFFLEYFGGQSAEHADWDAARELAGRLPAEFAWERSAWDARDAIEGVEAVFRDFDREYTRPAHLLDPIWEAIDERPRGYIHLTGPEGDRQVVRRPGSGAGRPVAGAWHPGAPLPHPAGLAGRLPHLHRRAVRPRPRAARLPDPGDPGPRLPVLRAARRAIRGLPLRL